MSDRAIAPGELLRGERVSLRLATLDDCTPRYEAWLADPAVNQYLETRWEPQPLAAIREFVSAMLASPDNHLFAIVESADGAHVGNIKVGPVNARHAFADMSYFIGERQCWGRGYATEAIRLATDFGFARLGLHRLQAGLYAGNVGSGRALEKAGYRREAVFARQLKNAAGAWEDHVWYAVLREEWRS
ncbi:MAG TPA: GNAT family protein [Chloroflexota bacterium]|jgi:RimJ/RimL family protein N-acetyltransferase